MSRMIFAFIFVFAAIFVAAYMLIEQAGGLAKSPKEASGTELAKNDEAPANKDESKSASATSAGDLEQAKSANPKSDAVSKPTEDKSEVKIVNGSPIPDVPSSSSSKQRKSKGKRTVINRSAPAGSQPAPKPRETNGGIWDEDLDRLHGTWRMVDVEYNGLRNPDQAKEYSWVFKNDEYTINHNGDFQELWVIEINSSRSPKTIDSTGTLTRIAPITGGKKIMGIYEVTDDTLKVCFDLSGNSRPDSFKADPGSRRACYYFKR
jgi:uncharacterized protein (TIGR03067 family)